MLSLVGLSACAPAANRQAAQPDADCSDTWMKLDLRRESDGSVVLGPRNAGIVCGLGVRLGMWQTVWPAYNSGECSVEAEGDQRRLFCVDPNGEVQPVDVRRPLAAMAARWGIPEACVTVRDRIGQRALHGTYNPR